MNVLNTNSVCNDPNVANFIKQLMSQGKYYNSNGFISNITEGTMKYSQYGPEKLMKLGENDSTFNNSWDNDYVLLNTDRWRPPFSHSDYKKQSFCIPCGNQTSGYPTNLKDFYNVSRIMPPDNISINYINDVLNKSV